MSDQPPADDRDRSLHVDRAAPDRPSDAAPSHGSEGGEPADRAARAERAERARVLAIDAARSLFDDKCEHVLVLDLRGRSQVTDFFVIASGTSERQMRAAATHAGELGESAGFGLHKSNINERGATWFVLDFVDVVVHVFEPETRLFYDLEMLWGDAPRAEWRRPEDAERERARRAEQDEDASGSGADDAERSLDLDDVRPTDPRNRAGLRPDDVVPPPEDRA